MERDPRELADPGTPAFQYEIYPFYLLNRLVSRYNAVLDPRLRAIGVDIPTWRALMILGEASPRSVGQISEAAVINLSTMMRMIQRMQDAGLVRLAPRPDDRRVTEVFLTPLGDEKLAAARRATAPVYACLTQGLTRAGFEKLVAELTRMYDNLSRFED